MTQKIVLALLLTCGIFLVGCSDDDSGGSSGLSCDSPYSAPGSLEGGEVSAVVSGGGGQLCGVAGGLSDLVSTAAVASVAAVEGLPLRFSRSRCSAY